MKTKLVSHSLVAVIECESCGDSWPVMVAVTLDSTRAIGQARTQELVLTGRINAEVSRGSVEAARIHDCEAGSSSERLGAPLLSHTANRPQREQTDLQAVRDPANAAALGVPEHSRGLATVDEAERLANIEALRARECPSCGGHLIKMSAFGPPEQRLLCVGDEHTGCGMGYRDPDERSIGHIDPAGGQPVVISAEQVRRLGGPIVERMKADRVVDDRRRALAGTEYAEPASFVSDSEQVMINEHESRLIASRVAADRARDAAPCSSCGRGIAECVYGEANLVCCGKCMHPGGFGVLSDLLRGDREELSEIEASRLAERTAEPAGAEGIHWINDGHPQCDWDAEQGEDVVGEGVSRENASTASGSNAGEPDPHPEPVTRGKAQEAASGSAGPQESGTQRTGLDNRRWPRDS